MLSIHRFVQDVIKAEVTAKQGSAANTLLAAARLISSVWPYTNNNERGAHPKYQQTGRWSQCESLSSRVHRFCDVYKMLTEEDQMLCASQDFIELVNEGCLGHSCTFVCRKWRSFGAAASGRGTYSIYIWHKRGIPRKPMEIKRDRSIRKFSSWNLS